MPDHIDGGKPGNAGSPLPGHTGAEHVWGKPYQRIDKTWWQTCTDAFCAERRPVVPDYAKLAEAAKHLDACALVMDDAAVAYENAILGNASAKARALAQETLDRARSTVSTARFLLRSELRDAYQP